VQVCNPGTPVPFCSSVIAGGAVTWSWTLYVSAAPSKIHGGAESLDEAKAVVDQGWQNWLDTAGLQEKVHRD
jgi:hypothetical protein